MDVSTLYSATRSLLPTLLLLAGAIVLVLFVLPALVLWGYKATLPIIMMNVVLFILTSVTFFLFFEISQRDTEPNIVQRVMNSFLLMSIWMGLSISNSQAIIEGIFNIKSDFKRTPKFRIEQKGDSWAGKKYVETINAVVLVEAALVIYLTFTFWYVLRCKDYFIAPFVAAFIYGFGYTAFLSFRTIFRKLVLKD